MSAYPDDDDGNVPTEERDHHRDHHRDRFIALAEALQPGTKAVIVLIQQDPEDPDSVRHIIDSYGVADEWYAILGVLATGTAYATTTMFVGPEVTEEEPEDEEEYEDGDEGADA